MFCCSYRLDSEMQHGTPSIQQYKQAMSVFLINQRFSVTIEKKCFQDESKLMAEREVNTAAVIANGSKYCSSKQTIY